MRRALDALYCGSGWAAAGSLLLILVVVLVQVGFNLIDRVLRLLGETAIGLLLPSYAEIAGYLLVGATFLALGGSLRAGSHIRVNLLLRRLTPGAMRRFDCGALAVALVAALYFTWFAGRLTWNSVRFGDLSTGLLPIPLWLPQTVMTAGLLILAIALADELTASIRGRLPAYRRAEQEGEALQQASSEL